MISRPIEKHKKSDLGISKGEQGNPQTVKRHLLQSNEFGASIRRHSVYGALTPNLDFPESLTHRISSKELKSLQKYKSSGRHEADRKSA